MVRCVCDMWWCEHTENLLPYLYPVLQVQVPVPVQSETERV